MSYTDDYLHQVVRVVEGLDRKAIDALVELLVHVREAGGRLFVLGVGGSAGNAGHAVNDFRKLAGIEAYAPTDNISELTARINDDGWETSFAHWLEGSRLQSKDLVLVFSVGGGHREMKVSINLVKALEYAQSVGAHIGGIVGRDGGFTAQVAHTCVVVPTISDHAVTPLAESFQAVIWHLLVSHPDIQTADTKW